MKILVIAHNEVKANEAEKAILAVDDKLKVKKVYLGAKSVPRHFEAVVIYHTSQAEINFIKDEIQRYGEAPIKAYLAKVGAPVYGEAGAHKAKAFSGDKIGDLLAWLKQNRQELEEFMLKCFNSLDKDGNGYIEATELRAISKELGRELDSAEADECLKDIDINKDNKISYDEFAKWWLSGRQGLSPWMRALLSSKVTTLKLMDTLSAPMKQVLGDVTEASLHDIATSSLTLNINNVDEPGLSADIKLLFLSPQLQKEHQRVSTLHSLGDREEFILNLSFKINHDGLEEVKSHID
jgi:hypothetical protein